MHSLAEMERYYFYLLRNRIDSEGLSGNEIVFEIKNGKESIEGRRRLMASDTGMWVPPEKNQVRGILDQFANLTELARQMGVSRMTIGAWKRGGSVSYVAWHFLCESLGIVEPRVGDIALRDIELPSEPSSR